MIEALAPRRGSPGRRRDGRDLVRGTMLSEDVLASTSIPSEFAPPVRGTRRHRLAGRVLESDVTAGEVITRVEVGPPGSAVGPMKRTRASSWR